MKIFFFLISLCTLGLIKAQNIFNVAYHDKVESAMPCLVELFGEYHFFGFRYDAGGYGQSHFYKVSNGAIKYRVASSVDLIPTRAKRSMDNKVVYIGGPNTCDVIMAPFKNYIIKHDTNGVIAFTNCVNENVMNDPVDFIQYSDSSYFVFTDSLMYHFDKNGVFLLRKNTGLTEISSALFDNSGGGDIYVSAKKNSAKALCMISTLGVVTNTLSAPVLYRKMDFYGASQIIAMGADGNLYKYSYNFVLLGNSNASSFNSVKDFVVAVDTIYGITSNSSEKYFICDSAFTTTFISTMQSGGITQKAITCYQGKTGVLSEALSKTTPSFPGNHNYVTLNVYNSTWANDFYEDVAVVSIAADSLYALIGISSSTMAPNTYTTFIRSKVKVKNKGTTSLQKFNLNYYLGPHVACGAYWWQQNYTVTVLPGDTLEIVTPFLQRSGYMSVSGAVQPPFTQTVCIFATIPNGKADKYYQDNELCTGFNFPFNDVRVVESSPDKPVFQVYPNPFSSQLFIGSNEAMKGIILTDQLGRMIISKYGETVNAVLDLKGIENGIYLLKIETEKGTAIKKVIKN
jgi:hypothetical protein